MSLSNSSPAEHGLFASRRTNLNSIEDAQSFLSSRHWAAVFASATLLGAFLIFQVQPVISKCVLPWFGGTPAVWTTCMLFFQVLLFGGYLYAHVLSQFLRPAYQGILHACLLALAAWVLPIEPADTWKPTGDEDPTIALLVLLAAHVALPYFVLSSTGPLIQAWLSQERRDKSVYRLYALSNFGSLAALLSYPFLVEPLLSVTQQSLIWSITFAVFAVIMGTLAVRLAVQNWRTDFAVTSRTPTTAHAKDGVAEPTGQLETDKYCWILLPAFASIMLLAVTNHVCQDLAVVPFLWILPLSLYLASFVITFDSPAWYRPKWVAAITLMSLVVVNLASELPIMFRLPTEVAAYMIILLGVCLICHGEVVRRQPPTDKITHYYVWISLGGALGGIAVALVCPFVFSDYRELHLASIVAFGLSAVTFISAKRWSTLGSELVSSVAISRAAMVLVALALIASVSGTSSDALEQRRNFFGVLRVDQNEEFVRLVHGGTNHGMQFRGVKANIPTSYYGTQSGVGIAIALLQERQAGRQSDAESAFENTTSGLHVGVVGLGCGVLATYGRRGEQWDFYEINPDVVTIAETRFTFLSGCQADVRQLIGDGRLLLERESETKYDLLVIDAFSSDSIPAHLLTVEAMRLYRQRLKPDGVIAIHLSNNHLNLTPLAHRLAAEIGWHSRDIRSQRIDATGTRAARWLLATEDVAFWDHANLNDAQVCAPEDLQAAPLWTDQHHNLASAIRWGKSD